MNVFQRRNLSETDGSPTKCENWLTASEAKAAAAAVKHDWNEVMSRPVAMRDNSTDPPRIHFEHRASEAGFYDSPYSTRGMSHDIVLEIAPGYTSMVVRQGKMVAMYCVQAKSRGTTGDLHITWVSDGPIVP